MMPPRKTEKLNLDPRREYRIGLYQAANHSNSVFKLWQSTLQDSWPINSEIFLQFFDNQTGINKHALVALHNGVIAGFIGAVLNESNGSIFAHFVDPLLQRQGIGTALHDHMLNILKKDGVMKLWLGGGYLWTGVPSNLPKAISYYGQRQWEYKESKFDLVRELNSYLVNVDIQDKVASQKIEITTASPENSDQLLRFIETNFFGWLPAYKRVIHFGDYNDILLALTSTGEIIGSLIMSCHHSNTMRTDLAWKKMFNSEVGTIACVGVSHDWRGKGIGIALVDKASAVLRQRGAGYGYIDWTDLVDFYGKLGYAVWQDFNMSWRLL